MAMTVASSSRAQAVGGPCPGGFGNARAKLFSFARPLARLMGGFPAESATLLFLSVGAASGSRLFDSMLSTALGGGALAGSLNRHDTLGGLVAAVIEGPVATFDLVG